MNNNNIITYKSAADLIIGIILCGFAVFLLCGILISARYYMSCEPRTYIYLLISLASGIALMIHYGVKKPRIFRIDEFGHKIEVK